MANFDLTMRYQGDEAEEHRLPAFDAGLALSGLGRTVNLVGHYLAEGEVRKRAPFSTEFQFYYIANRPGSFEEIFRFISADPLLVGLGVGIAGNAIWDAVKLVLRRASGQRYNPVTPEIEQIDQRRSGDLDSLVDAAENSIKNIHAPIGNGASNIAIIYGSNNTVRFNEDTKAFVETTKTETEILSKTVSIASFNANTKYGRAFDYDENRTIPFQIVRDAEKRTRGVVAASLSRYASGSDSHVVIKYLRQVSADGQIKKYLLLDAWRHQS